MLHISHMFLGAALAEGSGWETAGLVVALTARVCVRVSVMKALCSLFSRDMGSHKFQIVPRVSQEYIVDVLL